MLILNEPSTSPLHPHSHSGFSHGVPVVAFTLLYLPHTGTTVMANPLLLPALAWARKLRYPTLFKLTAGLFLLTLLIPDPLPLVDELLLGLGTLLLANMKSRAPVPTQRAPLEPR